MTDTANLALPCIEAAQAQKHVTHNEALRILDSLVQLAILDRDLGSLPGSPGEGERWIVQASPPPSGAWAGHGDQIAAWQDDGWQFSAPKTGWLAYAVDEATLLAWDGDSWEAAVNVLGPALQNITLLGVGTTADTTNPLSAKLNNALWAAKTVAEGGDGNLRYKLSKESAAKTLSYLFQDNFSGRAEIGLTGDDDFHLKVSADGTDWIEAAVFDRTNGGLALPAGFKHTTGHGECRLVKSGSNLLASPHDGNRILIDGLLRAIPSLGVALAPGGLSANTTYFIYLAANAGAITHRARSSNVATLTSAAAHGLAVGSAVVVSGVGGGYDGTYAVTGVPTSTTFSYANTGANEGSTAAGGAIGGLTLEASTTGHAGDATLGVEVKSGDATRTLVGMARTNGSAAWVDSATQRFVRSWFNRQTAALKNSFTADRATISVGTPVELNSEIRCEFLTWADEVVSGAMTGYCFSSTTSYCYHAITFDGTTPDTGTVAATFGSTGDPLGAHVRKAGLSEGYHYATFVAWTNSASTITFAGGSSSNPISGIHLSIG